MLRRLRALLLRRWRRSRSTATDTVPPATSPSRGPEVGPPVQSQTQGPPGPHPAPSAPGADVRSRAERQQGAPLDPDVGTADSPEPEDLPASGSVSEPEPPDDRRGPALPAGGLSADAVAEPEPELVAVPDLTDVSYPVADGAYAPAPRRPVTAKVGAAIPVYWPAGVVRELLEDLRPAAASIDVGLAREPLLVAWPVASDTGACRAPALREELLVSVGEQRGSPRTLDHALPNQAAPGERQADALDRLELVRLLAILLDELHRRDLVTRGATWRMFAFSLDPRPALALTDAGSVRRVGGEFLIDPSDSGGGGPFEPDREGFGSLARALLDAPRIGASYGDDFVPPGLDPSQARSLRMLWERHDGLSGSRPQVSEWRHALGIAASHADGSRWSA